MNIFSKVIGLVRAIFDTEYSNEYFIKNIEDSFYKHKKEFPGNDQHVYLQQVWLAYMAAKGADISDPNIKMAAPGTTYLVACTPPLFCARALGVFLLYRERPEVLKESRNILEEFNKVILPVIQAVENGTVDLLYRRYNPKSNNQDDLSFFKKMVSDWQLIEKNGGTLPIKGLNIGLIAIDEEKKTATIEIRQTAKKDIKEQGAWYHVPYYGYGHLLCENIKYKKNKTEIKNADFFLSNNKSSGNIKLTANRDGQEIEIICDKIKVLDFNQINIGTKEFKDLEDDLNSGKFFSINNNLKKTKSNYEISKKPKQIEKDSISKSQYSELEDKFIEQEKEVKEYRNFFNEISPLLEKLDSNPEITKAILEDKINLKSANPTTEVKKE